MASASKLTFRSRLGIYKYQARSVCTFNPETCVGVSYDWWCFVRMVKGKVVFNDHAYSVTTRAHQSGMRNLLRELGIEVFVTCDTRKSLDSALAGTLEPLYERLYKLEIAQAKRGAKPRTEQIAYVKEQIRKLRSLGAKLNQKPASIKQDVIFTDKLRLSAAATKRKLVRDAKDRAVVAQIDAITDPEMRQTLSLIRGSAL